MKYYCIMIKSGAEEIFKADFEKEAQKSAVQSQEARLFFFKKKMKNAKKIEYEQALFPGYVFLQTDLLDAHLIKAAKSSKNFYRFLNSNQDIQELKGQDREHIKSLLSFGETQGISKARFDSDKRIVIESGPLKGFEGKITRVNKKRGRATVQIDFCNSVMKFDLAFEDLSAKEK